MSMNSLKLNLPGFGGSNTRKTNGVSTQAKRNLSNSSAASRSTHFQLSGKKGFGFVSGQFVTKGSNKFNYDAQRAYYNSRGSGVSTRTYTPPYGMGMNQSIMPNFGYSSKGMDFMNSLQMGTQIGKNTFSFLNNIGVINTNNNGFVPIGNNFGSNDGMGKTESLGFTGQLSGTTSFTEINSLESQVKEKKASLSTDYKKLDKKSEVDNIISEGKEGFEAAGASLDTAKLSLSALDSKDLDTSMETIDKDIKKIGDFETNDLANANTAVTSELGIVTNTIEAKQGELEYLKKTDQNGTNTARIQELESEISKLKEKKEQLEKAKSTIKELTDTTIPNIRKSLESKKAEIKDIKNFEDKVKDKKYDLAKSQDNELKKTLAKLQKLDKEIQKASVDENGAEYNKKDDKRADKLKKLNAERSAIFGSMGSLIKSLSAAGSEKITNSNGQTYTITNLQAALKYKPEQQAETK